MVAPVRERAALRVAMLAYGIRHLRANYWLVAPALLELLWVDLALRVVGFRRLAKIGQPSSAASGAVNTATFERARMYARRILIATHFCPVRAQCLHRSLVLHRWLQREGQPSELRIGVRMNDGEFGAHAWVELAGQVVNDAEDSIASFAPLAARSNRQS